MSGRRRCLAAIVLLAAAACNLWPGELGAIELPHAEAASPALPQTSIAERTLSPPRTVDQDLETVRERTPSADGESPRAVRELGSALRPLSVAEMRRDVLHNNLDLKVVLLDPQIARRRISAEEGRFDALIGSHFRLRDANPPPTDGPIVDFSATDPQLDGRRVKLTEIEQRTRLLDLGLGLRVPLPTGGEVAVEGIFDEKITTDPQRFEQYEAATRFSLSQPLLRGAGTTANLAPIRIARVDERLARVRTKLACLRILADAEKAYWRLFAARRLLDVRAEQFRLASDNLELVRRRFAEGLAPRVEIPRAEVGVYSRLEALIVAETEWRLRNRDLKAYLASDDFPLQGPAMVETTTEPLLAGLDLDSGRLVEAGLAQRLELIELELEIVRDGIRIDVAENRVLPIANLDFRYGIGGRDGSWGSAWGSQWDFDNHDVAVGLRFELPLTNQQPRARLDEALLGRARRLASKAARRLSVQAEVLDMVDVIGRNWQRIVAARQNVIVAGVNYDAERRQFEQGLRTMREVLEALTDLGEAQTREIRAIAEYQVAQIDLAFATGTLLGYARVDLEPLQMPDGFDQW